MKSSFSQEQELELHRLYSTGSNDYEVARALHVGRSRLREWRESHDLPSKTTKKGLTSAECPGIVVMLSRGFDLTGIAKEYGVYRTSISKLLKRCGIEYTVRSRPRPSGVREYSLTDIQKQILVGDLFGDGGLVSASSSTAYYFCMHSIAQKQFVLWKHAMFSPLSARLPDRVDTLEDGRKLSYVGTQTWSSMCLRDYYLKFYARGESTEKILTLDLLCELTPLSMAVWYMGDGSLNRNTGIFHVGLINDLVPIAAALSEKFSMLFKACRYERQWHLRVMDPDKFFTMVSPYLLSHFRYKVPERYRGVMATDPVARFR